MNDKPASRRDDEHSSDVFGLAESDPELLNSGRIPDPQTEHTPLFRWLARVLGAIERRLRAAGGAVLRLLILIVAGFVAVVGGFLLVGPVINAPMSFDDVLASTMSTGSRATSRLIMTSRAMKTVPSRRSCVRVSTPTSATGPSARCSAPS